ASARAGVRMFGGSARHITPLPTPSTKARQWLWPCRPRDSTGAAPGRGRRGAAFGARAPVPADRRAMPTDRRVGLRGLGPALGVVLPRLAAAVWRHVAQTKGAVRTV